MGEVVRGGGGGKGRVCEGEGGEGGGVGWGGGGVGGEKGEKMNRFVENDETVGGDMTWW